MSTSCFGCSSEDLIRPAIEGRLARRRATVEGFGTTADILQGDEADLTATGDVLFVRGLSFAESKQAVARDWGSGPRLKTDGQQR